MKPPAPQDTQPCIICGQPSTTPLCYREECLAKWNKTMKEAPKP